MKRTNIIICLAFYLACAAALASQADAGVVDSVHNFSPSGLSQFSGNFVANGQIVQEVCVFCHTPHSASKDTTNLTQQLLWNRSSETLNYNYTMYSSSTLTTGIQIDAKPKGLTLMCMSCHDGVTTIQNILHYAGGYAVTAIDPSFDQIGDQFQGGPLFGWGINIGEGVNPGDTINLGNDHPVSFSWVSGLPGINDPDTVTKKWANGLKLFNNRMECSTCHDVHDPTNSPFLRVSNGSSGMCITCHNK